MVMELHHANLKIARRDGLRLWWNFSIAEDDQADDDHSDGGKGVSDDLMRMPRARNPTADIFRKEASDMLRGSNLLLLFYEVVEVNHSGIQSVGVIAGGWFWRGRGEPVQWRGSSSSKRLPPQTNAPLSPS
jgi:hypothetical protein